MARVVFIVNPVGGGGRAASAMAEVARAFPDAQVIATTGHGGGAAAAVQALADGFDTIVAVGGDGTVSEVGGALVGTEATLAVVPCGTGNDYARTLGLPTDPVEAARVAFDGASTTVDVGRVEGGRYFLNIAGCGFDAEVMKRFNSPSRVVRGLPVKARYYLSILQTFARFRGVRAEVQTDEAGFVIENLLLLAVGCARFYGAGMHILPMADLKDGLFDLAWGHDIQLSKLGKLMNKIYSAEHVDHPNVKFSRCRSVTVACEPRTSWHIDGDVTGETPVTFVSIPAALQVKVPRQSE